MIIREDVGVGREQREVMQQQIAEIDGVQGEQSLLIFAEELAAAAIRDHGGLVRGNLVRREAAILPAIEGREQHARRHAPVIDVGRGDDLLHQAQLIVGIQDGEIRLEPDALGVPSQDARMERAEPEPVHGGADGCLEPRAHFARGLVREGDREQLARKSPPCGKNVGKPRGEHACFAGAGASEHQHRSVYGLDRLALSGIKGREIRRRHRGHHRLDLLGHASL